MRRTQADADGNVREQAFVYAGIMTYERAGWGLGANGECLHVCGGNPLNLLRLGDVDAVADQGWSAHTSSRSAAVKTSSASCQFSVSITIATTIASPNV